MFDPDKVGRYQPLDWNTGMHPEPRDKSAKYVLASDYDQLLSIHLRHVRMIAELFSRCGEPLSEEKIASLKNGTWT